MKKIINGKRYDTETSEVISEWDNSLDCGNFRYYEETLYRTRNGNWFLHGKGGQLSPYAEISDNGRCRDGSADLLAFTPDEAADWLAAHDVNAFERHFPEKIQDA